MAPQLFLKVNQTSPDPDSPESRLLNEDRSNSSDDTAIGDNNSPLDHGYNEKHSSAKFRQGCCPAWSAWRHPNLLTLTIAFFAMVTVALIGVQFFSARKVWLNCGTSPEEARARGCKFDMLSHAWQTPECYDEDISEGWRLSRSSTYYLDNSYTQTVSEQVVMQGDVEVYVDQGYHTEHCPWMWRQLHRAYAVRGHIDDHLDRYEHTLHCHEVLMRPTLATKHVSAKIIYPNCHPVWHSSSRFRNVGVYGSS